MSKRLFALIALAAVLALTLTGCSLFADDGTGDEGGDGSGSGTADDPVTITYMVDGELFLKQVVMPTTVETTSRPNKAGYTFIGWYADEACTTPFDFDDYFADEAKTDVTVYAGFEEIVATAVTIIYMADGGQFEVQPVDDGVTAPTTRIPGKAGHKFTGWYEDEACTQLFDFDAYFAQDEKTSVIVYAGFEVDKDAIIQIIYYVDGNVAHTQNVTAQTSASDADAPHKAGHKFTGWYADAACTELFDFNAYFKSSPRNTVSVYAGFDEIADVLLHYSVDGEIEHTQTVAYDTTESDFADPVKYGYEFIGWFADAACETPFDFGSYFAQTDKAAETTVYAAFEEIIEIFYYADGELFATQTVDDDTTAAIANQPSMPGYVFAGWYDGKGADAQKFDFEAYFDDPDKTDATVYARFDQIAEDAVQISYVADGLQWRTQVVEGDIVTPATVDDPVKEGYVFAGWYEDAAFENLFVLDDFVASQDKTDITVYARFDVVTVTLTFMSQGVVHDTAEVTIESAAPSVAAPERDGYEFIGWYVDAGCTKPFVYDDAFDGYFTADAADVTVYAGFARIATITYLADGATPVLQEQTVTSSTSVSEAQIPEKPGYDFVGWYLEGEEEKFNFGAYFEFSTERQDVTLRARFEVRTVYIWYYADPSSDELFHTQPVTIDTKQEYDKEPSKQGYKFKAWYTDPECTEEFDFDAYFEDPDKQSVRVYAGYESTAVTTTITYYVDGVWFGEQSVSSADDPQLNKVPTKFAYEFTGWYEDADCKTKFEYDKFMASSDRGAAKSVYAGFKLLVTHIDEDGNGICDIDGHTDKVLVYTDNSGLELFDYRIGFISGNDANNSVKLAQAIPGGSDFTLVGADGYVTLDGNKLTAVGATPSDTPVLLQYIAESRNGKKIAKTVKVHVLDGYTNVTRGTWDHLYYTIMGYRQGTRPSWAVDDVPDTVNVCIQTELTAEAGKNFFFYDYGYEPNRDLYTTVGDSPYTLNLYGNALPIDVTAIMTDTKSPENTRGVVFRLEWVNKQINVTDLHMYSTSRSGIYFGAHGSTGNVIPVFNITHCLVEGADTHIDITASIVNIDGSVLSQASGAIIKAQTTSYPGCDININNSVLADSGMTGILLWGTSGGSSADQCEVNFTGFADFYIWTKRDNINLIRREDFEDGWIGDIAYDTALRTFDREIASSDYDAYFSTDSSGNEYINLVGIRLATSDLSANTSAVKGLSEFGVNLFKLDAGRIVNTSDLFVLDADRTSFGSGTWYDPSATVYGDADLNYELNFGRS